MSNNATVGGRVSITMGSNRFSARGEINLMPSGIENETIVNQDGTLDNTVKPRAKSAEMSFSRGSFKWDDAMLSQLLQVTFAEDDTGYVHTFTNARIIGVPSINLANGEVTGLTINSAQYGRTNG